MNYLQDRECFHLYFTCTNKWLLDGTYHELDHWSQAKVNEPMERKLRGADGEHARHLRTNVRACVCVCVCVCVCEEVWGPPRDTDRWRGWERWWRAGTHVAPRWGRPGNSHCSEPPRPRCRPPSYSRSHRTPRTWWNLDSAGNRPEEEEEEGGGEEEEEETEDRQTDFKQRHSAHVVLKERTLMASSVDPCNSLKWPPSCSLLNPNIRSN